MSDETKTPVLKAIVAMASNRVIGKDGQLPWHLPADLKSFKKLTLGHPIVMGRKTMESIGRLLPGRRNVVVSRSLTNVPDGYELVRDLTDLRATCADEPVVFVIGGAELFQAWLPECAELYLTYVFFPYEGDVLLPEFESGFTLTEVLHRDDDFELRHYQANPPKPR